MIGVDSDILTDRIPLVLSYMQKEEILTQDLDDSVNAPIDHMLNIQTTGKKRGEFNYFRDKL